jgi:hypothetical protein
MTTILRKAGPDWSESDGQKMVKATREEPLPNRIARCGVAGSGVWTGEDRALELVQVRSKIDRMLAMKRRMLAGAKLGSLVQTRQEAYIECGLSDRGNDR